MKKMMVAMLVMMSSVAMSKGTHVEITEACIEKASYAIVSFLEKEEPTADLHMVKNKKGQVISIADASGTYSEYDALPVRSDKKSRSIVTFKAGDAIIFAEVQVTDANSKAVCKILNVDMGQDDQD